MGRAVVRFDQINDNARGYFDIKHQSLPRLQFHTRWLKTFATDLYTLWRRWTVGDFVNLRIGNGEFGFCAFQLIDNRVQARSDDDCLENIARL